MMIVRNGKANTNKINSTDTRDSQYHGPRLWNPGQSEVLDIKSVGDT